jgi:hypothetical protein
MHYNSTTCAIHLLNVFLVWVRKLPPALECIPEVVEGIHLLGKKRGEKGEVNRLGS